MHENQNKCKCYGEWELFCNSSTKYCCGTTETRDVQWIELQVMVAEDVVLFDHFGSGEILNTGPTFQKILEPPRVSLQVSYVE